MTEIKVAGLQKNSFVDWPGNICSVIFLGGCNFDCYYCHNRNILCDTANKIPLDDVLAEIKQQIGFVDGIVISGGEPTIHPHLREIIMAGRELGLPVKLDTNGSNFEMLKQFVESGLIDYVAMDIKAPLQKYKQIVRVDVDLSEIEKSINYLKKQKKVDFMFRTTPCPGLTKKDFDEIKKLAGHAKWKKNDFIPQ